MGGGLAGGILRQFQVKPILGLTDDPDDGTVRFGEAAQVLRARRIGRWSSWDHKSTGAAQGVGDRVQGASDA